MARAGGGATITIKGLDQVNKKLRRLPAKLGRTVIRKAMRQSLKPVQARVRELAPAGKTGQIKGGVRILAARARKGRVTVRVVIGKGWFKGDSFYAGFQEYGWQPGRRGGTRGRHIAGKHFMRHAYEQAGPAAKGDAEARILAGVLAELAR
jgi:HK97 gp10 family phage protein